MTSRSGASENLLKKRPLTAAEKSKRYRERLKTGNPEKYMITKEKSRRRSAKYYEEKVKALTEEKRIEMRIKWRQKYASKKESLSKTRRSSVEKDEFEVEALESEDDDGDPLVNTCNTYEYEEKPASLLEPRPNNRHGNFETLTSSETIPTCIKTEEYLNHETVHTNHRTGYDEYDHFGLMLASKIRKIKNVGTREELMNSIQNLAYKFYMRDLKNNGK